MTESAIERELQAALAIEPSPEFLARMRTRIANEPAPSAWRPWWAFAAGGALAAAVAIAFVASTSEPKTVRVPDVARASKSAESPVSAREPGRPPLPVSASPLVARTAPGISHAVTSASREPEAFIDLREARAIQAFLDDASRNRIDLGAVANTTPPVMETTPVQEIYFAPIAFEPVTAGINDKGVPQ